MSFPSRRLLPLGLAALLALAALVSPTASGQTDLGTQADRLGDAVAAERARIANTRDGLADAEQRLAALEARVTRRNTELQDAQESLVRSRIRLARLQQREAQAKHVLADNLVASYKAGRPELASIVLSANGFADLFDRLEFLKRQSENTATILDDTRAARAAVAIETRELERLRSHYSVLAAAAVKDRDAASVIRNALLEREQEQLARLGGAETRLANVRREIAREQRRQAAAARQASGAATATEEAPVPSSGSGSGDVVARVVSAANEIATTPYVWGGGHGGASGGYDCSGSLSYALAAGGLLSSPLDSTGFMSWGEAGPGSRITVYANSGHAYMVVDGRRFDTSALSGGGTRWTSEMRSSAGFVARHPPGY